MCAALIYHLGRTMGRHMRVIIRAASAAMLAALIATSAPAQGPLRIFDAHLHYNQEPTPFYELDKVLEMFRRNNVTGIIATSRPNKGTHQLVDAKAPGQPRGASCPSAPDLGHVSGSWRGSVDRRDRRSAACSADEPAA